MKTIGERIRQARELRGMSQASLAALAGFAQQSAIGNLENRATGRGGFNLPKIASALGVPLEWLMNGPDGETVPFLVAGEAPPTVSTTTLPLTDLDRAIAALRRLPPKAVKEAAQYIDFLATKHDAPSDHGADHHVPAPAPKAA